MKNTPTKIGVNYYPEHWDEKRWTEDADMMKKIGVGIVRLAEFTWCRLEPHEGEFDFSWLDRAVEVFHSRGIDVVLCTPTNCPPLWAYEKYDISQYGCGKPTELGIRGHRCYNSPKFRELCERIITKMTEHYRDKNILAWQIDNELDAAHCTCETCKAKFREFLKAKYGTLDSINIAYGNVVWSGEYSSWEQINPPEGSYKIGWYNPSFTLDWFRFCRQSVTDFARFQAELIHKNSNAPITTNTWFCEYTPDFYRLFDSLDFVSFDNYPVSRIPDDENAIYSHAFHLDFMRGIKRKSFWIMEELSGATGCWSPIGRTPEPGMIEGYSMQAIAHGAENVLHFRWRSAAKGAEMFWHGIIDQSGVTGRKFEEFSRLCEKVNALKLPQNAVCRNEIALLFSPDSEAALQIQEQADGFHYYNQLKFFHDAVTSLGKGCDIVAFDRCEFDKYKVIIVPAMFVANSTLAKRLEDFCSGGGTVIVTNRSGVKDKTNCCREELLPTVFSRLTGCVVPEYEGLGWSTSKALMNGREYDITCWADLTKPITAETKAVYAQEFYKGTPCVTVNNFGKGKCLYVGVIGRRDFYKALMRDVLDGAGVEYIPDLPDRVEITRRYTDTERYTFIFNNSKTPKDFVLEGKRICLKPYECAVLKA